MDRHTPSLPIVAFILNILLLTSLQAEQPPTHWPTRDKVIWKFNHQEQWFVWQAPQGVERTITPTGTWFGLPQRSQPYPILSHRIRGTSFPSAKLSGMRLELEISEGSGKIALNLEDEQGEGMHFGWRELHPGKNIIEWPVSNQTIKFTWGKKINRRIDGKLRLWNLQLQANATCRVRFIQMKMITRHSPLELIKVDIRTPHPVRYLLPDEAGKGKLILRLSNENPNRVQGKIDLTLEDFWGQKRTLTLPFTLDSGGSANHPLPLQKLRQGIWWVRYRVKLNGLPAPESGSDAGEGIRSFCVMEPAGNTPGFCRGFLWGVNGGIPNEEDRDALEFSLEAARLIGVEVLRTGFNWEYISPAPGRWNEKKLAWYDEATRRAMAKGLELQLLLAYCTRWASHPERARWPLKHPVAWLFVPPPTQEWEQYLEKLLSIFGTRIRYWEVWNEADMVSFWRGTAEEYAALLQRSAEVIHRQAPAAKVMTSGFATVLPHGDRKDPDFMKKVITLARDSFDILAHHQHGDFTSFRRAVDGELARIRRLLPANFPLYFNETAYPRTRDSDGERKPAWYLVKKLVYARSRGAIGYTWFNLISGNLDLRKGGFNWGLLTDKGYPVAAYPAYNTLVKQLRGKTFIAPLQDGPTNFAYLFGNFTTHEYTIVYWREPNTGAQAAGTSSMLLRIPDGKRILNTDIMGNPTPLELFSGLLVLDFKQEPAYVSFSASAKPVPLPSPVRWQPPRWIHPGTPVRGTFQLQNPFPFALTITFTTAGLNLKSGSTPKITLAPGEKREVAWILNLPDTGASRKRHLSLDYQLQPLNRHGRLSQTVHQATFLQGPDFTGQPQYLLESEKDVVNFNKFVPQRKHLTWQGPDDLSARVWLAIDEHKLKIKAEVHDDIHHCQSAPPQIWKSDSIQVGLCRAGEKGFWELGAALREQKTLTWIWSHPAGKHPVSRDSAITATIRRTGKITSYLIELDLTSLGYSRNDLQQKGLRFSLLVNDNDGPEREGWIELTPGLGKGKETSSFLWLFLPQ